MMITAQHVATKQLEFINWLLLHKLIIALSIVLLSACATARVQPDYDATINFNQYKSYILHKTTPDRKGKNLFVHSVIAQEIDNELGSRNYTKFKDDGKQDFIVDYQLTVGARQPTSHGRIGIGTGIYGSRSSIGVGIGIPLYSSKVYQEGVLLIQITDSKLNRVVWQAMGTRLITIDTDREKTREHIRETVKQILTEFPPKK